MNTRCMRTHPLAGEPFTALLFHHTAGPAHLRLFGLLTKWMQDSTGGWTQPITQKPCSRFKLLLPRRWQAPLWMLQRVTSLCCSPCLASRTASSPALWCMWGWALTQSSCHLHQLQPAQISPSLHWSNWESEEPLRVLYCLTLQQH